MKIEDLVQLHKNLTGLMECFKNSGMPQEVNSDYVRAVTDVQVMIEQLVSYMKKRNMKI